MASTANVVFLDPRIMDVAYVLDLVDTQKFFFNPPPPHSCLILVIWYLFFLAVDCPHLRWQYMLNESLNLYLYSCGYLEFNKPAMCQISLSHFSP